MAEQVFFHQIYDWIKGKDGCIIWATQEWGTSYIVSGDKVGWEGRCRVTIFSLNIKILPLAVCSVVTACFVLFCVL